MNPSWILIDAQCYVHTLDARYTATSLVSQDIVVIGDSGEVGAHFKAQQCIKSFCLILPWPEGEPKSIVFHLFSLTTATP